MNDLFDRLWDLLAAGRHCDARGGAEYLRVREEALRARDLQWELARQIITLANVPPEDEAPSGTQRYWNDLAWDTVKRLNDQEI